MTKYSFYILTEEVKTRQTIEAIIQKVFPKSFLTGSEDGISCLEFLEKNKLPLVILADMNAQGFSGFQLAKKVKTDYVGKPIHVIVITDKNNKELNLKAIQSGAGDFLNNPFSIDDLIAKIKLAIDHVSNLMDLSDNKETITYLKKELDETSDKIKSMLLKFLDIRLPELSGIVNKIAQAAAWIGNELSQYEEVDPKVVVNAASLCFVGKLFLKDKNILEPVLKNGQERNNTMSMVPVYARELIEPLKGYEGVALALYHIYENYDGSGIPEKIQQRQIPVASRILRVCIDFENLIAQGKQPYKALEMLEHENKRLYDFRVVVMYEQYLSSRSIGGPSTPIPIKELDRGMQLAANVITNSGHKLLPSGTVLKPEHIEKVESISKEDPIIGKIYIRR
jgi:response regulator RpfG family c-di-GMP phosphodiesterase